MSCTTTGRKVTGTRDVLASGVVHARPVVFVQPLGLVGDQRKWLVDFVNVNYRGELRVPMRRTGFAIANSRLVIR